MTTVNLLLCLNLGFCVTATIWIMARYWPDRRWWHILCVGISHLLLSFSALHTILSVPDIYIPTWKSCLYLIAFTGTDAGLFLFVVQGAIESKHPGYQQSIGCREPEPPPPQ